MVEHWVSVRNISFETFGSAIVKVNYLSHLHFYSSFSPEFLSVKSLARVVSQHSLDGGSCRPPQ